MISKIRRLKLAQEKKPLLQIYKKKVAYERLKRKMKF